MLEDLEWELQWPTWTKRFYRLVVNSDRHRSIDRQAQVHPLINAGGPTMSGQDATPFAFE
jgi:hypothetical protein